VAAGISAIIVSVTSDEDIVFTLQLVGSGLGIYEAERRKPFYGTLKFGVTGQRD
jgi:hypothetical protein